VTNTNTNTDAVRVFDYLLDQTQRRAGQSGHVPEQVVICALRHATAQDAEDIAHVAYTQGRYNLAEQALTQAHETRRDKHGEEHPDTLSSRNNLAIVLDELGRREEAEAEHRAVLQIRQRVLGVCWAIWGGGRSRRLSAAPPTNPTGRCRAES
jgi:Flp pilus assembly protein TadD